MEVGFYHCTRSRPFDVVPVLAAKVLAAGQRALVHAGGDAELETLDALLWTYDSSSFLPHGRDYPEAQPILLSDSFVPVNGASVLIAAGSILPGDAARFDKIAYVFDGGDEASVNTARRHWRALSGRGDITLVYWTQADRGWQKAG